MQKALTNAKLKRESRETPESYILAKVNFTKKVCGTIWVFAEVLEVKTTISAEKNVAEKIQRMKPKIKVAQSHTDIVTTNLRYSNVSNHSMRSSSGHMTPENSFITVKDDSMVVIESPKYVEVIYGGGEDADIDGEDFNLASILDQTGGYLTVFSVSVKAIEETSLDQAKLNLSSSDNLTQSRVPISENNHIQDTLMSEDFWKSLI